MKLTQLQVSEKKRYQNCLTWSNLQIASVVSDVFGKSAQKMIQSILDNPEEKPDIEQILHKRMKDKVQDLEIAIKGNLTPEQVESKAHYDALAICKEDLEPVFTSQHSPDWLVLAHSLSHFLVIRTVFLQKCFSIAPKLA